jgi:predicted nucleotidyltransferase component of viral defense system
MHPGAWREIWRSEADGLRRIYRRQVALLIRTLPFVAAEDCFVIKGGTAINLFVGDLPRLSVDIDLTCLLILMRERERERERQDRAASNT